LNILSTGNEFVSIPEISTETGGIGSVGFIHQGFRACIELHGSEDCPLLQPVVEINGQELPSSYMQSELVSYWIPRFNIPSPELTATAIIFAPLDRRGFVYALTVENTSNSELRVRAGWRGCWQSSSHTVSLSKPMSGSKHANISFQGTSAAVIEFRGHAPMFAMALASQEAVPVRMWNPETGEEIASSTEQCLNASAGSQVCYELMDEYVLQPSEKKAIPVYIGIGLEEVSALASALNLRIHGWDRMLAGLTTWLDKHTIDASDERLKRVMNVNSFYNYFYAQAMTTDTEELVITAARSSRSDSCAIYRDRDAMRWSLPAVLQINWTQARKMLIYALTTQLPNVGLHSRFINGIALEPGLQLDQLCAPVRALHTYVQLTGDMSILFDRRVQTGINTIKDILIVQRNPASLLFETLLMPSGEPSQYPYVCFSNVLVWRVLLDLAALYERIRDVDRTDEAIAIANKLRTAIMEHFVVPGPNGDIYARAVDLEGHFELGDDPEGSLLLLTYFGFCTHEDPVYKNTVDWINSSYYAEHKCGSRCELASKTEGKQARSVLGVANELLAGHTEEALEFLRRAELDGGIACECAEQGTGRAISGMAYAGAAGYLAFGLRLALNGILPEAASALMTRRPTGTLYQPPPEIDHGSKKARL